MHSGAPGQACVLNVTRFTGVADATEEWRIGVFQAGMFVR